MAEHDSKPIRRFRAGGYGAMVEDDNGIYVRFDEMQEYQTAAKDAEGASGRVLDKHEAMRAEMAAKWVQRSKKERA